MSDAIREAFEALERFGNYVSVPFEMMVQFADDVDTIKAALQSQTAPAVPDDDEYEIRADGKRVRKDRWETGFRNIVTWTVGPRTEFEIDDIVALVRDKFAAPQPDHSPDAEKVVQGEPVGMIPVDEQKPTMGVPVIGFSPAWIDPDFNDRGFRECFTFGDANKPSWHSAKWLDEQDCYTTGEDAPTHWFPMVVSTHPAESREEIKAQELEDFADDMDRRVAEWKAEKEKALYHSIIEGQEWSSRARLRAARLRASQQEGGE